MAKWTGVITNAGNSLLNAWVGEKTLRFDCAKAGTGTVEIAALMAQTDLVSQKQDATILNAESVDGGIRMKLRVTASQEGYLLNQFGVWASVDGNTALIAIYQHDKGVSVPGIDESPDFAFTFYALIMTSNTGTWTVNIDTSALVTLDDMNSAIAESAKKYLPLSGGKMAGNIDMQGKAISGLNEPTNGTQAAPKSYVDKRVPLDGSQAMNGNLSMGDHRITDLAEPEDGGDAATKEYTDTKAALPKTASGTVIALSDASSGPLQGLRIYGRTTQDGTPTPDNPVELVSVGDGGIVGVTVAGKNIVTGITNGNSANNYSPALYAQVDSLVPDTDYFISFTGASGNKCYSNESIFNYSVFTCTGSRQGLRIHTKKSISKDNLSNYNPDYGWFIFKNNVGNTVVPSFTDVQIEAGAVMTDYEAPVPAQSLPISTPNGLPGIPVDSGGNYTDANGQQWICDEVDFARGVYVQRVFYRAYNGSEGWNLSERNADKGQNGVFYLSTSSAILTGKKALNSRFKSSGWGATGSGVFDTLYGQIRCNAISTDMTVAEWKSLLAQWAADGAPMEFMAQLATPIETPIPEAELTAYAALHTNRPNTTVYNDAGAYMDVGYYPPDATMRQEDIMGALDHVGNAAREYVDSKRFLATVSLPAASWIGDAAPYTQTVPVSGILETDFPHVTPVYSSTLATALAQKEAWSMVNQGVPGAGEITFTCFEEKPATAIPIQIEVTR